MLASLLAGCAGHAGRTQEARSALDAGRPEKALELYNEELDVASAEDIPTEADSDNALLLLDRSMILQSLGSTSQEVASKDYELSSRDLEVADKGIEVLDLSRSAVHEIGKYLFSDNVGPYKAPPYEKLMINTMNMVNYLVRSDLDGGRVEARRLAVMQQYITEHESPGEALMGPGSYYAGFIFEKSGRYQEALRYYDEALQHASFPSLEEPIRRLAEKASYRTPRIRKILEGAGGEPVPDAKTPPPTNPTEAEEQATPSAAGGGGVGEPAADNVSKGPVRAASEPPPPDPAEILVIINFGRVPAKVAKRVPIGLALTFASGYISPQSAARANYLAAQGLVTWVNYPELGQPRGEYGRPGFALDGDWSRLEEALAVDREARKAWDDSKGAVIASAITRMITRVVAGEGARRATGGGIVGALVGLGTQAALVAADTPDTRCWSTLPARIAIGRVQVPPGTHYVDVEARGVRKRERITLEPGGWAVVNLTVLR